MNTTCCSPRSLRGRPRTGLPRHGTPRAALAVAVLVLAAGCGSSVGSTPGPNAAAPTSTTEASPEEPGAPSPGAPGEGGDATPSPGDPADVKAAGAGAAGGAGGAGGDPGDGGDAVSGETGSKLPLSATFASACVRPGTPQTIIVRSDPDVQAIYHATYSDGKTARDPGYYGGHEISTTDAEGRWEDTWVVGAAAPPGRVRVDVVATSWETFTNIVAEFAVAGPFGLCP